MTKTRNEPGIDIHIDVLQYGRETVIKVKVLSNDLIWEYDWEVLKGC